MQSFDSTVPSISKSHTQNVPSTIVLVAATTCLVWYIAVAVVCLLGYVQIFRHYSRPTEALAGTISLTGPNVTIIRPVKGLEPCLYSCLASTLRQRYPYFRLHHRFCISSRSDPALPTLEKLLRDFPDHRAQILVEEEDDELQSGRLKLGPNPKIRNMSRAYREATRGSDDLVWIVDCNVWVGPTTLESMLMKHGDKKFVHQLPLVVDIDSTPSGQQGSWWQLGGGRLEELFMSSSHAKFYTAINTVLIAPCIVGKSTMFNMQDLDKLTNNRGIDYFSENICEDHLIGELLWKLGKHALSFGNLAIQPMQNVSVREYWERRVRWLRVRKFTVTLATLVEPGTESFLCSLYGAFALTTLPFFHELLGIPPTWSALALFWMLSVIIWCVMDWTLYQKLHSAASVYIDENTPNFTRPPEDGRRRSFSGWLFAWLGREALALPIWVWAFWGGTKVIWRGKQFWVGMDMKVHEINGDGAEQQSGKAGGSGQNLPLVNENKYRQD